MFCCSNWVRNHQAEEEWVEVEEVGRNAAGERLCKALGSFIYLDR